MLRSERGVKDLAFDDRGRVIALVGDELMRIEPGGGTTLLHKLEVCDAAANKTCPVACQCYEDISVTAVGTILVALGGAGRERVVEVLPGEGQRTVAGVGTAGFSGDGGPATEAQLDAPSGVAAMPDGSVLIADAGNNRVRRVSRDGVITTVAGNGQRGSSGDGGPATAARISVFKIAVGRYGGFVVGGEEIRRVTRHGIIRAVAGSRGPDLRFIPDRTTDRLIGNGGSAHEAYLDTFDLAITPDDDYLVAGYRLRMLAAPGTRRLAIALRTASGSRRRVSYALTRPAEVRLEVRSGNRSWTLSRLGDSGLGYLRLPGRIPDGVYQLLLTASTDDGQRVEREDTIVLGHRLQRSVALAAVRYVYGFAPALTTRGMNTEPVLNSRGRFRGPGALRYRCRRFGPLRVDCRLGAPPDWSVCSVNVGVRLDRGQGRLVGRPYACGPFRRRGRQLEGYEWAPLSLLDGAPWLIGR